MPARLETEIHYSEGTRSYLLFDTEENDPLVRGIKPDTPEYFKWLSGLSSFHFSGKEGHFTARLEKRSDSPKKYWTAFRKANAKQLRRYLGTTEKLSLKVLEDAARHLTEKANSQEPPEKKPRKRPEKREALYARIQMRDKTIAALKSRVKELEEGLIKANKKIQQLQNQLNSVRKGYE